MNPESYEKIIDGLEKRIKKLEFEMRYHNHNDEYTDPIRTLTGALIRTATGGKRIELSSQNNSQVRFLDGDDLIGLIEVDRDGDTGYLKIITPDTSGLVLEYSIGASAFSSLSLGGLSQSGTSSNGQIELRDASGTAEKYFRLRHASNGTPFVETDALPTSNPGGTGRLWSDSGTVKIT